MEHTFKRFFDLALASLGIIISFPLCLICAALIWAQDRGPVFYIQERIGKNNIAFPLIKFRTMHPETKKIPIVSGWLRMSAMDELPQLINILKGDMSFVGPRPLVKEEMDSAQSSPFLQERLRAQPGLTGVAQLLLSKKAAVKDKILYDVWYLRHFSLALDIKLIMMSYAITILGRWETDIEKLPMLYSLNEEVRRDIPS